MSRCPELEPAAPLQFVINAAAGSSDAQAKREDCCFIERWDFAGRDLGFVRTTVTPVQPERT